MYAAIAFSRRAGVARALSGQCTAVQRHCLRPETDRLVRHTGRWYGRRSAAGLFTQDQLQSAQHWLLVDEVQDLAPVQLALVQPWRGLGSRSKRSRACSRVSLGAQPATAVW